LLHRHILPQTRLEHLLAHALRRDHRLIALLGKFPVLLQRRHTRDELGKLLVADHQPGLLRLLGKHPLRDQRIKHGATHLRSFEHGGSTFPPSWARTRSCCSRSADCNSGRLIVLPPTVATPAPESALRT
jgi:hypothetical protein